MVSYAWSNGSTSQNVIVLAGTYTVTIYDLNGCSSSCSFTVSENPINIQTTPTNINCTGTNSGSITANVTGGNGSLTYLWNTGSVSTSISNLYAGIYTVTVTDQLGCSKTKTVQLTQAANNFLVSVSKVNVRCGGKSTGSVTAIVAGGVSPYNFIWNTGDITSTVSNLAAGTYTVTVTDAMGCSKTKSATITQNGPLTLLLIPGPSGSGLMTANASGGVPPYSYNWNTVPRQITQTATGLTPLQFYKVKVTDSKGCTITGGNQAPSPKGYYLNTSEMIVIASPNPTNGIINFDIINATSSHCRFRIYDNVGQLVLEKEWSLTDTRVQFDMTNYARGVYSVLVDDGTQQKTVRVVVQ